MVSASYMANYYIQNSLLGTRRVILSIITRNFFVIRNKQPMTIGTNRLCISRDDNCVNTMCFPRQLPTTARNLLSWLSSTGVIRVVLSVSYLLVSYFVVNFLRRVFSQYATAVEVCVNPAEWKVSNGASKLKVNAIFCDRLRRGYKLTLMSAISSLLAKERFLRVLNELHLGKEKPLYGIYWAPFGDNKACWGIK